MVDGPSNVARYPPTYYLLVGAPVRAFPQSTGILLARLLSVVVNALLLAAAVWVAARRGNRLLMAAVGLVATPTVVNLAGAVNPNGLEISAAVLLFVALLALLPPTEPDDSDPLPRLLCTLAGAAAFLLLTVRHSCALLLAVDLVAVGLIAGRGRVRQLLRSRDTWTHLLPFVAVGVVASVVWVLLAGSPVEGLRAGPLPSRSAGDFIDGLLTFRIPFYVRQIVGQFGYGETTISPFAIALWYSLVAVVVVPAAVQGGRRLAAILGGLVIVSFTFLVALEIAIAPTHGWFAHGRYAMPMLVGTPLIAAWAQPHPEKRLLSTALIAAALPVHVYALARVMTRYQISIDASLNPLGGTWHPAWGSLLPLACIVSGATLLAAAIWARSAAAGELSDDVTTQRAATPPGL